MSNNKETGIESSDNKQKSPVSNDLNDKKENHSDKANYSNTKMNKEEMPKEQKWDRDSKLPPQMMKRWFGGGPETDEEIKLLF